MQNSARLSGRRLETLHCLVVGQVDETNVVDRQQHVTSLQTVHRIEVKKTLENPIYLFNIRENRQ